MGKEKRVMQQRKIGDARITGLSKRTLLIIIVESILLCGLLAWIFFDSIFGALILPGVVMFVWRINEKISKSKREERFDLEFKEMLVAVSDALSSGYSIENAFKDAEENIKILYGENGIISKDIREMNMKISMRIPAEQAFDEFAGKYQTEEAIAFSRVFSFARRLGGDYVKNLKNTIEKMEDKLELKQEIRAGIAEKQTEFLVMSFMPIGILLYVKLSSPEFVEKMYGNLVGIIVMSICILIYFLSILMGQKIVDIKV